MIEKKTWEEFRDVGLLWFVNTLLHIFGWAIVFDFQKDGTVEVYPVRTKFRGFSEENNTQGYIALSDYLKENAATLSDEARS